MTADKPSTRSGIRRRRLAQIGLSGALSFAASHVVAEEGPGRGFVGINALWIPGDEPTLRERFSRAKALGFDEVRIDWEWRSAETRPGRYDWTTLDRLVRVAHQTGVELLPIVHYAPDWAVPPIIKGDGTSELAPSESGFEALGQFLVACVERYAADGNAPIPFTPIEYWQVWNEPNGNDFWGPAANPKDFARMMRIVADALAPYRDRIKIVHAGLSKADLMFLWQLWDADPKYGETFDIMAVHPYIFDWWKGVRRPEDMDTDVAEDAALGFIGSKYKPNYLGKVFNLQLFMTLRGAVGKPIWITEMGYFVAKSRFGVTEEDQAKLIADTMDFISRRLTTRPFGDGKRALPANVQRVYWFALDDYPMPDEMGNFGLYRLDHTERPSVQVIRRLLK